MQRYLEQHNEVELSALGMGTFSESFIRFFYIFYFDKMYCSKNETVM